MSQMNIDATVDQLGDDFDVQGAAASRKKGFIGLAAAIATLIFLLVGALAIVNLKASRMKFD